MPLRKGDISTDQESWPLFVHLASGSRHLIGITTDGVAFSWGRSNAVGQLGRNTEEDTPSKIPGPISLPNKASKGYTSNGCSSGSGHSAILDDQGMLWMAGCDRWQQLGLGSSKGGSSGYTWQDGKLWQDRFVPSNHVTDLMKERHNSATIRDVSLGGDHTLVLASNQQDVYAFGKGGDRQLGLIGKQFVSAPVKSTVLSEPGVSAVCAVQLCSMTLDENGNVKKRVGRCRSTVVAEGIQKCIARATHDGLVSAGKMRQGQTDP
jgi:alpha-tubulin suppressor-like RCC1 family protein